MARAAAHPQSGRGLRHDTVRRRLLLAVRQGLRDAVLLPVDPRDVPALSLRPGHASRLEGIHSRHADLDRLHRRDDADALGLPVSLTAMIADAARDFVKSL